MRAEAPVPVLREALPGAALQHSKLSHQLKFPLAYRERRTYKQSQE